MTQQEYTYILILWCFVYTEYSFPLNLIENVDWFHLYCWIGAGEAATQLYWDTVAGGGPEPVLM